MRCYCSCSVTSLPSATRRVFAPHWPQYFLPRCGLLYPHCDLGHCSLNLAWLLGFMRLSQYQLLSRTSVLHLASFDHWHPTGVTTMDYQTGTMRSTFALVMVAFVSFVFAPRLGWALVLSRCCATFTNRTGCNSVASCGCLLPAAGLSYLHLSCCGLDGAVRAFVLLLGSVSFYQRFFHG